MGVATAARAQEAEPELEKPIAPPADIKTAVRDGSLLPSTLAARVGEQAGLALGFGGYDGARAAPIASATAEVRVWGPFALRGSVDYSNVRKEGRAGFGGRVQLVRPGGHGGDGWFSGV